MKLCTRITSHTADRGPKTGGEALPMDLSLGFRAYISKLIIRLAAVVIRWLGLKISVLPVAVRT